MYVIIKTLKHYIDFVNLIYKPFDLFTLTMICLPTYFAESADRYIHQLDMWH